MKLASWLGRALSGASGSPSTARLGFLAFVVLGGLWLTASLAVSLLAYLHDPAAAKEVITSNWSTCFGIYATTCTAGYVGGKVAGRPPRGDGGAPRESGAFPAPGGA